MKTRPLTLTTEPVWRLTWRIAVPASLGVSFSTLLNVLDVYLAGLLGTEALAAFSLSFPLYFAFVAFGSGLNQGAAALIANALGAADVARAARTFTQAITFGVVTVTGLIVVGFVTLPALYRLLGAQAGYLELAVGYGGCLLGGAFFQVLALALTSVFFARGETRVYRNYLLVVLAAKSVLSPILIWGLAGLPALGLRGLAVAWIVAQAGGCLLLWRAVRRSELGAGLVAADFRPDRARLRELARQSLPTVVSMEAIALGLFVVTWFVQQFGRDAVAAFGLAARIEQVLLLPLIGLGASVLALVGQNHGAGLWPRVGAAWRFSVLAGTALMLLGSLLLYALARPVVLAFTPNASLGATAVEFLQIGALTLPAYPVLFATTSLLNGLKRPAYGFWMGTYRQVLAPLAFIPALAFGLGWGLTGVWWAMFAGTWTASLFALWWGWRTIRLGPRPAVA